MAWGSEWTTQAWTAWVDGRDVEEFLGHMMLLYRGRLTEDEARDLQQISWLWRLRPDFEED